MPFIPGAEEVAKEVMAQINPDLSQKFSTVIQFLSLNPDRAPDFSRRKVPPEFGGREYIQECAKKFADAHPTKRIKISTTIPDQAALIILEALYQHIGKDVGEVADVLDGHGKCMTIENKVGDLLERYIASIIEKDGWVWCPGEIVKHIDYIRPPTATEGDKSWLSVQTKNSDVSENSSSKTVRNGTDIQKWHRKFSKKPGDNWANFPATFIEEKPTEAGFLEFVRQSLDGIMPL